MYSQRVDSICHIRRKSNSSLRTRQLRFGPATHALLTTIGSFSRLDFMKTTTSAHRPRCLVVKPLEAPFNKLVIDFAALPTCVRVCSITYTCSFPFDPAELVLGATSAQGLDYAPQAKRTSQHLPARDKPSVSRYAANGQMVSCYRGFVVIVVNARRVPDRCQDTGTRDGSSWHRIMASYIVRCWVVDIGEHVNG
jgi:hypothetical protein